MPTLFWDASGLAKRYALETGSPTALVIFAQAYKSPMVTTLWGYTETYALLLRKCNSGFLSTTIFTAATTMLQHDMLASSLFRLLIVTEADTLSSITYIQRYSLNSTDAALLATLLRYASVTGETCVLIAADSRFCRSALAEGLEVLNPEAMSVDAVPGYFADLNRSKS